MLVFNELVLCIGVVKVYKCLCRKCG